MKLISKYLMPFLLFLLSTSALSSQAADPPGPMVINMDEIENNSRREEIQRYFGYENLFCRYVTIPYDTSVNTNQKGRYIDIGYGIIAVLPLVLLGLLYRRKKAFYATAFIFTVYLGLCFSYSYVNSEANGALKRWSPEWANYIQNGDKQLGESVLALTYHTSGYVIKPLIGLAETISGDTDHITYPVLSFLLLMALYLFSSRGAITIKLRLVSMIFLIFGFLWLILSGGIIWYGFLLFPLSYGFCLHYISEEKFQLNSGLKIVRQVLLMTLISWAVVSYVGRISNINVANPNNIHQGKELVNNQLFFYSTGLKSARQTKRDAYQGIGNALEEINSNDALIYQLGTSMAFDIKNNPNRLYLDAQLVQFFPMLQAIKDKEKVMEIYKAGGIRYMIIDLYTFTLDRTPEQSLSKKFTLLLNTLYKNPRVKLMATDRLIEITNPDGSKSTQYAVFGQNIKDFGRYAIFEII